MTLDCFVCIMKTCQLSIQMTFFICIWKRVPNAVAIGEPIIVWICSRSMYEVWCAFDKCNKLSKFITLRYTLLERAQRLNWFRLDTRAWTPATITEKRVRQEERWENTSCHLETVHKLHSLHGVNLPKFGKLTNYSFKCIILASLPQFMRKVKWTCNRLNTRARAKTRTHTLEIKTENHCRAFAIYHNHLIAVTEIKTRN